MGSVNHVTIGWIVERVSNRRQVITAPLRGAVALGDLLGDEVTEDGEFVVESVIDADDLLLQFRRGGGAAHEVPLTGGDIRSRCRQKARAEQRSRVRVNHARRDHVTREIPTLHNTGWCNSGWTRMKKQRRSYLGHGGNPEWRGDRAEITTVGRGIRD